MRWIELQGYKVTAVIFFIAITYLGSIWFMGLDLVIFRTFICGAAGFVGVL
jgi:hypothetical protein